MPRLACVLVLLAASCGARGRHELAPAPHSPVAVATPIARPPAAATTTTPTPPPPPLDAITKIDIPFPADAILLDPIIDLPPVVLFADERTAIRHKLAQTLGARGRVLVPIDWLERIEAAAQDGRLLLEDDLRCRVPPTHAELVARYFAERPRASLEAICDFESHCQLQITIPDANGGSQQFNSAKVRHPEDPKSWLAAVPKLAAGELGLIGLGMIGTSHPPPIMFDEPQGIGAWKRQPDRTTLAAIEPQVAPCAHPDPFVGLRWTIRAAVDRRGRVTRCSSDSDALDARPHDGTCICDGVADLRFPPANGARRLRVEASDTGGFEGSGKITLVQPGTEASIDRLRAAGVLRRCLASNPIAAPLHLSAALSLARDGTVLDVRVDGSIDRLERVRFADCVAEGLRGVALPCAPPGISTLHAALSIADP